MQFKVDENLPLEIAEKLHASGQDVLTIVEQGMSGASDLNVANVCKKEKRVIVTLDLDFADIRAYPPDQFYGIIVLRVKSQDKHHIIDTFNQVIALLGKEPLVNHLWIVEENQIRLRGGA